MARLLHLQFLQNVISVLKLLLQCRKIERDNRYGGSDLFGLVKIIVTVLFKIFAQIFLITITNLLKIIRADSTFKVLLKFLYPFLTIHCVFSDVWVPVFYILITPNGAVFLGSWNGFDKKSISFRIQPCGHMIHFIFVKLAGCLHFHPWSSMFCLFTFIESSQYCSISESGCLNFSLLSFF